jgi:hypothetical protein
MKRALLVATCASLIATGAVNANLLTNGSFEDTTNFVNQGNDTMSLMAGSTALTGWTVNGRSLAWIGPTNPFGLSAQNGSYFLDLTDYNTGAPFGGVQQTVSTIAGHKYEVTFYLGSSTTFGIEDGLTASAAGAFDTFTSTNGGSSSNLWQLETFDFTASAATTTLSLVGASGRDYIGLDNVVMDDLGVGPVPEPSTWAMMLFGFVGLGLAGWRVSRRSTVAA